MIRNRYNPLNWYWGPFGGKFYSSATQTMVDPNDATFLAWKAARNQPTPWPKDETGNVTREAMQSVLDDYGLFVDLIAYAAHVSKTRREGGITVKGVSVETDANGVTRAMLDKMMADSDPNFKRNYKSKGGTTFSSVPASTLQAIAQAVASHVNKCSDTEANVVAGILASPPTVTTRAQVDAAFASA